MEQIRVVELFAGVGGFRLGLEQASANFQTVWANQWEPSMQAQFAFDCYERHFGHRPEHVCQDIVTAKGNIPPHDLLVGGFPCQDYSIAKKGARGIEGKKGVLWWEINAILRTHRPRYVLLENVDRLIKSPAWQKGRDFLVQLFMHFCDALFAAVETALNAVVDGAFKRLVELEWEKRNDARHQRHPHQRVACIVTDVQFLHLEALHACGLVADEFRVVVQVPSLEK